MAFPRLCAMSPAGISSARGRGQQQVFGQQAKAALTLALEMKGLSLQQQPPSVHSLFPTLLPCVMAASPYISGHFATTASFTKSSSDAVPSAGCRDQPLALPACLHLVSVVAHQTSGVAADQDQAGKGHPCKACHSTHGECSLSRLSLGNTFFLPVNLEVASLLLAVPSRVEEGTLTPRILSGCCVGGTSVLSIK